MVLCGPKFKGDEKNDQSAYWKKGKKLDIKRLKA